MEIVFYLFAVLAVVGAVSVLLLRSPVYCALSLVGTFFCLAAIYILLNAEFVATIQVLVYAGAIMVLFLFVIMLLNLEPERPLSFRFSLPKLIGAGVTVAILAQLVGVVHHAASKIGPRGDYPVERLEAEGGTEIIGRLLFTDYVLPFEIVSVLLLVSVIGAVVLAKRRVGPDSDTSDREGA